MNLNRAVTDKRNFLENESLDPLICVNPYEVNPLSANSDSPCAPLTADVPLKVESNLSQRSPDGISCGGFCDPQRSIKLEMEEFGDLSQFVSQKRIGTNSIDELNTPIFDKDAFDFDISNYENNVHADLHVMLKYDTPYHRGGAQNATIRQEYNINKDIFVNTDIMRRNITILPLENTQNKIDANMYSPPASENGTYIEKMLDYDMNNSVSVNVDGRNSSSYRKMQLETPDGSERSYNPSPNNEMLIDGVNSFKTKPKLSLDISLGNHNSIIDVSTPSLIAEVVSLEDTGFNILDLVNEDNITTDDIFSTVNLPIQSKQQIQAHKRIPSKQPRKRRVKHTDDDDDDDDDYVPPSKKSTGHSKRSRTALDYASTDSEYEEERPRKKARGRPPKRTESISSDCSKDGDVSRYRELRDKNNEASRKSRLKRKLKDLELEKEAEELHSKNIKLKAQVGELEKMVNNFRDNLFKIMINK